MTPFEVALLRQLEELNFNLKSIKDEIVSLEDMNDNLTEIVEYLKS